MYMYTDTANVCPILKDCHITNFYQNSKKMESDQSCPNDCIIPLPSKVQKSSFENLESIKNNEMTKRKTMSDNE
jgi:hypothetical protein